MRIRFRVAGATLSCTALLIGSATAARIAPAGSSLAQHVRASVVRCGSAAACVSNTVDTALSRLDAQISALPRAAGGPSAWIGLSAGVAGFAAQPLAPLGRSPSEAILTLYRDADVRIDGALLRRVDATLETLDGREAAAVGDLVGSLAAASRAAREATRGTGLERIVKDPVRAMHLATFVTGALAPVSPELRTEWETIAASLARVDMVKLTSAALTLSGAIARIPAGAFTSDVVDLPLIFIGGEGNTTYSDPLLLQVDVSGNDTYLNNAGGGVFGAGGALAVDLGSGNDMYSNAGFSQGFGLGAAGILYDEGGSDSYNVTQFGQGAGVAGIGMLYDAGAGNDSYLSPGDDPIATKAASLGGLGVLVDEGGNDFLHQNGLDGFVYGAAGGTGLMANLGTGNDSYQSDEIPVELLGMPLGTFAGPVQVSAEAGGTALLYEEGGSDTYQCGPHVRQGCQGAGGVGALALLWDRGGNDTYSMGDSVAPDLGEALGTGPLGVPVFPMGQGIGYGPSAPPGPGIGILRDEAGRDQYVAAKWAQGFASLSGIGLLYDTGAAPDIYDMQAPLVGSRADGAEWVDGTGGLGLDR